MRNLLALTFVAAALVGCKTPLPTTISCPVVSASLAGVTATCSNPVLGTITYTANPADAIALVEGAISALKSQSAARSTDSAVVAAAAPEAKDFSLTIDTQAKTETWTFKPTGAHITRPIVLPSPTIPPQ